MTTSEETLRWQTFVIAGLGLASAVLGYLGLRDYVESLDGVGTFAGADTADIAYYTLQLFVAGSAPLSEPASFPLALEIARIAAPASTVLAIIEAVYYLLRDRVDAWRSSRLSGHMVVVGDTELARRLATELGADHRVVRVARGPGGRHPRAGRIRYVQGEPDDPGTLRAAGAARAARLYACAGDANLNVAVALLARARYYQVGRRSPEMPARRSLVERLTGRPPQSLQVFAEVADIDLAAALRARRIGMEGDWGFRLDFFASEGLAAQSLARREADRLRGPVAVVGFGPMAQALLLELGRLERSELWPLTVAVDTAEEVAAVERFSKRHRLDLVPERPIGTHGDEPVRYFCVDDLDRALSLGLGELRTARCRVVIALPTFDPIGGALAADSVLDPMDGRLEVFGMLDAASRTLADGRDFVDRLAEELHSYYEQHGPAHEDRPRAQRFRNVPWGDLPPDVKESNRRQAEDIGEKLHRVAAVVVPAHPDVPPFEFTPAEIEHLAEAEHERWMAEKRQAGLEWGPKLVPGRFHPHIKGWSELDEEMRDVDRMFVKAVPGLLASQRLAILRYEPLRGGAQPVPH